MTPVVRLEDMLEKDGEPLSGCILWTRCTQANGYGRTSRRGRVMYAHRAAWEDAYGPIPPGLCVLHRCDVRACVNPEHLFLGTKADNNRDAAEKGRMARGERQHRAKLTEDQVREIRMLAAAGEPVPALARRFGVNEGTIWPLIRRQTWAHVA